MGSNPIGGFVLLMVCNDSARPRTRGRDLQSFPITFARCEMLAHTIPSTPTFSQERIVRKTGKQNEKRAQIGLTVHALGASLASGHMV